MKQRTEQERVQELKDKIAAIEARGERKRARANPAVRHAVIAVKAIDKAVVEATDAAAKKALGEAREPLSEWLASEGLALAPRAVKPKAEAQPEKRARKRKNNTAVATAS